MGDLRLPSFVVQTKIRQRRICERGFTLIKARGIVYNKVLVKRNTNAGRAGRAPGGRDEGRVVSCGGEMRMVSCWVMTMCLVHRVGAQGTKKEDES